MIIGREEEKRKLEALYLSESAELVALYGRRRVGKTYLIDETFGDRICFRHAGLSPVEYSSHQEGKPVGRMKAQLEHFYRSLVTHGYDGKQKPQSWLEAFYFLEDLLSEKYCDESRVLIFFDEIQWLDTPKSEFMTGFEAFWNGWACHRKNIMVIVCGSSSSWILNNVINNHGGLYGRVTCEIKLRPFSLGECEEFFKYMGIELSRYDIAQAYMAVGGIPYYLRYFTKGLSLSQNIEAIFFENGAPLRNEYDRLFASLFTNAEVMQKIVKAIYSKNRGLTRKEIEKETGIRDSGDLSKKLKALESGDFIIRYCSFGNGKREEFNKLVDPFCNFYLTFVEANKNVKTVHWVNLAETQKVTVWSGYAFENVCWNHIKQIKAALGISGVVTTETLWSKKGDDNSSGAQIDLIIERKDNVVNMCEIKFYSDEFLVNKDYHLILEHRKGLIKEKIPKKATVHSTLITTFGIKKSEYFSDFVSVVTLEQLFDY